MFAIRAPKCWSKEAGQSFSEDKFKSREAKCVQKGPTAAEQKDRGVTSMLFQGVYIADIFSKYINIIKTIIQEIQGTSPLLVLLEGPAHIS